MFSYTWIAFFVAGSFVGTDASEVCRRVAVLSCDDFFYPNASFAFTARTCVQALRECGVPAEAVAPEALADPERFSVDRYPVFLNIYGDAYPAESLPHLQRYHRNGGCVISNGVPFGFACRRTTKGWEGEYVPQERSARLHSGMGTGWWAKIDRPTRVRRVTEPGGSAIPLKSFEPASARVGRFYGLDVGSLPDPDTSLPLIVVEDEQTQAVALGIIEHHCEAFGGAIDVWAGSHLFSEPRHNLIRIQEEVFVRACAYLLERRGAISREERMQIDRAMDRRLAARPADPERRPMPKAVRALPSGRIIPAAKPPADHLDVVDLRDAHRDLQRTALCLAGLANREQARLFIVCLNDDLDWLSYLIAAEPKGLVTTSISLDAAFRKHADVCNGAVIPPSTSELFCGINVATMAAAARDLVVATEEVAGKYRLAVREDLRGRWTSSREAYAWVDREHADRLRSDLAAVVSPEKWLMADYLVAQRVYILWVTGPRDAAEAGCSTWDEIQHATDCFSRLPLFAPVFGFGHQGLYRGLGEAEIVDVVSRFAKYLMVTNRTPNLSVYSSFPRPQLKQKRRRPPVLREDRVYVSLVLSDGDNLNYWYNRFPQMWKDPARGTFPIGWSIGPSGLDLQPSMYRRIYEQATENDCFVGAVSGLAYVYPEIFGDGYTDSQELLDGFLRRTRKQMDLMDLRAVHIHHYGPYGGTSRKTLERYAEVLAPDRTDLLFVGYGRHDWFPPEPGRPQFVEGVPVLYAATTGKPDESIRQIQRAAGESRPAFVGAFLTPWRFRPSEWKQQFDKLGPEYVLVTPEEFGRFARQWHDQSNNVSR